MRLVGAGIKGRELFADLGHLRPVVIVDLARPQFQTRHAVVVKHLALARLGQH